MIPGMTGSNALSLFSTAELAQLPVNEISRWYGGYSYLRAIGATGEIDGFDFFGTPMPCFAAETPILLADGTSVAIEDIRAGMRVAAFNERDAGGTAALTSGLVTRLIPGITTEWIVLDDASSARLGQATRVTPGHRYLRPDGSFMAIGEIVASDGLVVDARGTETGGASCSLIDCTAASTVAQAMARARPSPPVP